TGVEKLCKHFQIASLRIRKIDNRTARKKQTKDRAGSVKGNVDFCVGDRFARESLKLRAEFFEEFPAIDPFELTQLRQSRRHRQRISRKRPRLINWSIRGKLVHDFGASPECADRQTTADHFTQHGQIRFDSINFLSAAARDTKTGHHFIENQKRSVFRTFLAQDRQKILFWKIKPGVRRNRLENYRCDLIFIFAERFPDKIDIVERQRNGELGKCFRNSGAIGPSMSERATAGLNQK